MKKFVTLTSPLKVMVPIIKVTGDYCNLRCKYCFYNDEDQLTPHKLSDELLQRFITQYMNLFPGHLVFIWHGGEPLLAGLPFFHKVVELQSELKKPGQKIQNFIQTNATLINPEWAKFFKAHHFRVGISLDGDKVSHDLFRRNRSDKGSFDATLRGYQLLRKHGLRPGIIQTLTKSNIPRIRENFRFFIEKLGTKNWAMNTYFDPCECNANTRGQSLSNADLTEALKICIDLWLSQDDENLKIREVENFFHGVIGKKSPSCSFNGSCSGYFCLDYDGKIYPCDRSSHRPEMCFGDLSQSSLLEILNGPVRLKYAESANFLPPLCLKCQWKYACHNGCPAQRVPDVNGKYFYCQTRQEIFSHLREVISRP